MTRVIFHEQALFNDLILSRYFDAISCQQKVVFTDAAPRRSSEEKLFYKFQKF